MREISKVLVANRGEIALRIMRSLKEMGIRTVAIFSDADTECLHVKYADEAYNVGKSRAAVSYLALSKIVDVAKSANVDAVHPGYGFLAEKNEFAMACEEAGIVFIGPTPENMKLAGDKRVARITAEKLGVPVVPGSDNILSSIDEAKEVARQITYPVMIKASAGGGGRGIRILHNEKMLEEEFATAAEEARAAFSDPTLYMEKYLQNPRHIEVQILGDGQGNAIHLNERNCSVQRRHQKLIEEAPSPGLKDDIRKAIHGAAVSIAKGIRYRNAGTVEFLVDEDDKFYFMELNARVQVEHPVTEMITGIDLIKTQIEIASGHGIKIRQDEVTRWGHAIECRINAEDPDKEFSPSPGIIDHYHAPGGFGTRFDTHLYPGYKVPIHYDSLLGKLIAWGHTRQDAIKTLDRALRELAIEPIKTTKPFLLNVINHETFMKGDYRMDIVDQIMNAKKTNV